MKRFLGILALLFAVFALVFGMDVPKYLKWKSGDIKDYNTAAAGALSAGDLVQGTAEECWGAIAEREETNTVFGIKTSSKTTMQYYVLYSLASERYILYGTGATGEYTTLDKMEQETIAYWESLDAYMESQDPDDIEQPVTTLSFTGEVSAISSDLREIFEEWYGDGFTDDCELVYITKSNFDRFNWVLYAAIGCGVMAVLMLVLMIVISKRQKHDSMYGY